MNLVFLVKDNTITRVDKNEVISDSKEYVGAQFVFNFWDTISNSYDKVEAVLWLDEETEYIEVDLNNGKVLIPDKYIVPGSFKISLWITNGSISFPTNRITIDVTDSGMTKIERPDAYSKLEQRISELEKKVSQGGTNTSSIAAFEIKLTELSRQVVANTSSIASLEVRLNELKGD